MTDGPFYPPRAWREQWTDWDADLSRVQRGGQVLQARGEHLGLELRLVDTKGRALDATEVEIWQCDAMAVYHHPGVRVADGQRDAGFQGFGSARSDADGWVRFRTIRPVPYPGRTPHIHIKLRQAGFGEHQLAAVRRRRSRQCARLPVAPARCRRPGRAGDARWHRAAGDSGLRWQARHTLVIG